ncbi:hypothetical protein TI39_contig4216g00009 [Zymoseptoria brevis]|uniref:Uncharacterized protein n=1 Tax=Zymoseptoria brevis TaxID=1047168 RepID=A0A0F4G9P0_9PEZI|nr:hypothetical protein TI39_contig4216g00009 [Zymoseptoria brevis]
MTGRSNIVSSSSFSFSSSSNSSSNSSSGQATGQASTKQTFIDADGNKTVKTSNQTLGQPAVHETRQFDSQGHALGDNDSSRRIEDVSDEQAKNDKLYEERLEDEYAKREGGA